MLQRLQRDGGHACPFEGGLLMTAFKDAQARAAVQDERATLAEQDAARLLAPEQIAERWQCSQSFVTKQLRKGKLHGLKIGKLWRVRMTDLLDYEQKAVARDGE